MGLSQWLRYPLRASVTMPCKDRCWLVKTGPDERGARPSNNAPDNIQLAMPNPDGSPDYHGWPDRFGFLSSSQAVFNPKGGPSDDLCVPDPVELPQHLHSRRASLSSWTQDVPISDGAGVPAAGNHTLRWPPRQPTTRSPALTLCLVPSHVARCGQAQPSTSWKVISASHLPMQQNPPTRWDMR